MKRIAKFPKPDFIFETPESRQLLVEFADAMFPAILEEIPHMKDDRRQWWLFVTPSHGSALSALAKLPVFKSAKRMSDAYVLGYHRGLQEAAFRLRRTKTPRRTSRHALANPKAFTRR